MIGSNPFSVHEASVGIFHAWGDGIPVTGPTGRHLQPMTDEFRAGLKMVHAEGDVARRGFADWRMHGPEAVTAPGWMVEFSVPLGAMMDAGGVALPSMVPPGVPVVVVVRFLCKEEGVWRVFQFHDAVVLPSDASDESQRMFRTLRVSAGWMEEFKSGLMPAVEPRMRGVIEWRHLGRTVRCWEYDPEEDSWAEDAENTQVMDGQTVRYVSLDFSGGDVAVSFLAAKTQDGAAGGIAASEVGWIDAACFSVGASSGLTMEPGWVVEASGCAEPLLLTPSGRHWEHPRVVFRVLGRIYATAEAGVLALPALTQRDPDKPLDLPLRLGRLMLYPDGGWVLAE